MADTAHRLTDEKLEEMEKRMSAIYSTFVDGYYAIMWLSTQKTQRLKKIKKEGLNGFNNSYIIFSSSI